MSRLCVFFEAGSVRYAIDALGVLEVARPDGNRAVDAEASDLCVLLGGANAEVRPGSILIVDAAPALAARVTSVDGVFDASTLEAPRLARRLIPLLAPAVAGGLVFRDSLVFTLDTNSVGRGLPKQSRVHEVVRAVPSEPCLRFESQGVVYGVPLPRVVQVVSTKVGFNPLPSQGELVGALVYRGLMVPVCALGGRAVVEPLCVIVELGTEWLALSASRADGVRAPAAMADAVVIDLERTFS